MKTKFYKFIITMIFSSLQDVIFVNMLRRKSKTKIVLFLYRCKEDFPLESNMSPFCRKLTYFSCEIKNDDLNWTKYTLQKQRCPVESQDASGENTAFLVVSNKLTSSSQMNT